MTLKEKFLNSNCEKGYVNLNEHRAESNVKIADEFAIGFAEWIQNNCNEFPKEDQELILKIYKKEKGL
jgi:hypothetical protein